MKKYPVKSNWISYVRNSDGNYIVHKKILAKYFNGNLVWQVERQKITWIC